MSQLISLNIYKRDGKLTTGLYGFDVDDIVSPIRLNAEGRSYFSARMLKGTSNGGGYNNGKIEYEVTDLLAGIEEQSDKLIMLTVLYRRSFAMNSEVFVFNSSHISENIKPTPSGSQFFYQEDGDPEPVEYVVLESVADIVAQAEIVGGISGKVVNYSALPPANLHADEVWICLESQGTRWLPGSLGGTYYPHGQYYSTGTDWLYDATPYQASQADVNAGIITDQFVSPNTFVNASKWGSYVPYTGATANVDLGNYGITAFNGKIGTGAIGYYAAKLNITTSTYGLYDLNIFNSLAGQQQSIVFEQGPSNYAAFGRQNTGYPGNYSGTSIAFADTFNFQSGPNNSKGAIFGANPFIVLAGDTSTNKGYRMDVNGLRIGDISTLHTANSHMFATTNLTWEDTASQRRLTLSGLFGASLTWTGSGSGDNLVVAGKIVAQSRGTQAITTEAFIARRIENNAAAMHVARFESAHNSALATGTGCIVSYGISGFTLAATVQDVVTTNVGWENDQTNNTTDRNSYMSFNVMSAGSLVERFRVTPHGVRFTSATAPASPVGGDVWFNGSNLNVTESSTQTKALVGCIYTQTSSVTVVDTAAETSLLTSTTTLPANFFVAGKTLKIKLSGYHSAVANPNGTVIVKLGSTTIITSGAVVVSNGSNDYFEIIAEITCRTVGVTGTVIGCGKVTDLNTVDEMSGMVNTAAVTIDTTTSKTLDVTWTWGTASLSNTITMTNGFIEILN